MNEVIAMHGWSSDSRSWHLWEQDFTENGWLWKSAERGYSDENFLSPFWNKNSNKKVLIFHSLGIHLIAKTLFKKATHIVFINSFSRFIPMKDKDSRALQIGLEGMKNKLGTNSEKKMLRLFWEKASFPNQLDAINPKILEKEISFKGRKKLKADLGLLIDSDQLPTEINVNIKALVIDGGKDKIVLKAAKKELLEKLSKHLHTKPDHWVSPNEGHVILIPKIIKDTRLWIESDQ